MFFYLYFLDSLRALRFYSRIPIPKLPFETDPHSAPDFQNIARAIPMTGAIIGVLQALFLGLCVFIGLHHSLASLLCVGFHLLITGAFHEDGLADMADGFGGGVNIHSKLNIMKDSRLGTYGASTLFMSLSLQTVLIFLLLTNHGVLAAMAALIASASLSRSFALFIGARLDPARQSVAAFAMGTLRFEKVALSAVIASLIAMPFVALFFGIWIFFGCVIICSLATQSVVLLSQWQIKGQTGDVAGAAQQINALTFLTFLSLF